METSINLLIILALSLLAVGTLLLFIRPSLPSSRVKGNHPSVTVSGDGIITVRNASGGDLKVFFGNSSPEEAENVIPSRVASDMQAEQEVTILDELRDPTTPPQRKAEIETELLALGYRIAGQSGTDRSDGRGRSHGPSPVEMPQKEQPDQDAVPAAAPDEGLSEKEPDFESFAMQS